MKVIKRAKHIWGNEAGSTAVEFATVGLLAIVLCLSILEVGRALHLANELSFAADRGTRLVLLNPEVSDADVEAEVRAHLRMANIDGLVIVTTHNTLDPQTTRVLSVSLPLTLFIPTYPFQSFRVSVERKVPTP